MPKDSTGSSFGIVRSISAADGAYKVYRRDWPGVNVLGRSLFFSEIVLCVQDTIQMLEQRYRRLARSLQRDHLLAARDKVA